MQVSITVNGKRQSADVQPRMLLADFIRDVAGLTGTKIGCDTSQCGSCVVIVNGKSVKSCSVLAVQADGAQVTTVEALAKNGQLNALQEGFQEMHGVQCGFCSPGMLMSLTYLLQRNATPTDGEIRTWLEGNFCRCTGFQNPIRAAQYAVSKMSSPVRLVADSPGKKFYESQVDYLMKKDVDGLVDNNYNDDAVLVSFESVVQGKQALKEYYREYLRWVQIKEVVSTDKFTETGDSVFFEATARTNFGAGGVYDAMLLKNGKIQYHFTGVK